MYSETFLADLKSRVAISEVIGRSMKLRKDGKEFRCVDNSSLTINDVKGIWFDHATNEGGDALAWLQKSQGLSFTNAVAEIASMAGVPLPNGGVPGPRQQGTTTKRKPVAFYNYCDSQGELIYEVVRYEWLEDGKLRKTFRQRRPDPDRPNGWIWNLEGVRHGLYRLPELREAGADEIVFLPEGEKDVETLAGFGLVATTNSGGAKNWRQDHAELLRGRDVVVLVDNDDPGRERGQAIAASLHDIAKRVRILDFAHPDIWPTAPKHADVTDWVKAREAAAKYCARRIGSTARSHALAPAGRRGGQPRRDVWYGCPEGEAQIGVTS
jgi:DNA primase